MTDFKEFILGKEAVAFLKENRRVHGITLSRHLLTAVNLDAGVVRTFLPGDVEQDRLNDFEGGGVMPFPPESEWVHITEPSGRKTVLTPVPRDDSWVIAVVKEFLCSGPNRVYIAEEPCSAPTESSVIFRQLPHVTFGDDVYHFLAGRASELDIREGIKWTHLAWTFFAALTSFPEGTTMSNGQEIPEDYLRILAQRTEKIIIGAYDGEGYLLWEGAAHIRNH